MLCGYYHNRSHPAHLAFVAVYALKGSVCDKMPAK